IRATCDADSGECSLLPSPGTTCDDENACTQDDRCDDRGVCVGVELNCSALDTQCVRGTCDPEAGACVERPLAANTACDDGNLCTRNDVCDGQGVCSGAMQDCSALNTDCSVGRCDPATGACEAEPASAGTSCNDGNACTSGDQCSADGKCVGVTVDCADEDGPCTEGVCNSETGRCEAVPVDGRSCDDDDECTTLDVCNDGECEGT